MSHSASDGIGNRLYHLIPLALSFSLSLSLALSHSTPPLIHLPRTLLNVSPNPIFLSHDCKNFPSLNHELTPPSLFLSTQLPITFLFPLFDFFFFKTSNFPLHRPSLGHPQIIWLEMEMFQIWESKQQIMKCFGEDRLQILMGWSSQDLSLKKKKRRIQMK